MKLCYLHKIINRNIDKIEEVLEEKRPPAKYLGGDDI